MQAHEFLGQVQDKAHLGTLGEAMRATRATLETLAERLGPDDSRHLADQLPHEIQLFLSDAGLPMPERFSPDEFLLRVCAREGIAFPESSEHARVVIDVLTEAVSPSEPTDVLARLAEDYRELFASAGKMPA